MINSFKCEICGRFISYADLDSGKAIHELVTPDSAYTWETYSTYHKGCETNDDNR